MNLKNEKLLHFLQTYQKRKEVPYMEMSRDNAQKWKESPYVENSLPAERIYFLSYIDIFYKRCIVQLFTFNTNSVKNGCFFPHEHFPIVPGVENVI